MIWDNLIYLSVHKSRSHPHAYCPENKKYIQNKIKYIKFKK